MNELDYEEPERSTQDDSSRHAVQISTDDLLALYEMRKERGYCECALPFVATTNDCNVPLVTWTTDATTVACHAIKTQQPTGKNTEKGSKQKYPNYYYTNPYRPAHAAVS